RRRALQDPAGPVRGGALRPPRLRRHHRRERDAAVGRAGHAHRGRRRLLAATESDPETLSTEERAGRRRPAAEGHLPHRPAGVLVLVAASATRPLLLAFVSCAALLAWSPARSASAARVSTIRGRVELRRVATPAERRPSVGDLGTPAARDL